MYIHLELDLDYTEKKIITCVIFSMVLIMANVMTIKIIDLKIFDLKIRAGIIIYPFVHIISSIMADVYSKRDAQRNIVFGLGSYIVFLIMIALIIFLPSPTTGSINITGAINTMPRYLIAAAVAFVIANLITIYTTLHIKRVYVKSKSILKNIVAIDVGIIVDSALFMLITYLGVLPVGRIFTILMNNSILYVIWMMILTPLIRWFKNWLKA